jgi:hypothetical protein
MPELLPVMLPTMLQLPPHLPQPSLTLPLLRSCSAAPCYHSPHPSGAVASVASRCRSLRRAVLRVLPLCIVVQLHVAAAFHIVLLAVAAAFHIVLLAVVVAVPWIVQHYFHLVWALPSQH